MLKFASQFDEPVRFFHHTGSPIKILLGLEYDKEGNLDLVEKGKEDFYDYIQSHADSVDINVILARYQNGDPDALNKYSGFYGDITEAPKTFADVLNKVIKAEDLFNTLPIEEREKFNFNVASFINAIGSEEFNKAVHTSPVVKPASEPVSEKVDDPKKE